MASKGESLQSNCGGKGEVCRVAVAVRAEVCRGAVAIDTVPSVLDFVSALRGH